MPTPQIIYCLDKKCKHFIKIHLERGKKRLFRYKCKAFNRIPEEIRSGKNKHTEPLPNQGNKFTYEKE